MCESVREREIIGLSATLFVCVRSKTMMVSTSDKLFASHRVHLASWRCLATPPLPRMPHITRYFWNFSDRHSYPHFFPNSFVSLFRLERRRMPLQVCPTNRASELGRRSRILSFIGGGISTTRNAEEKGDRNSLLRARERARE